MLRIGTFSKMGKTTIKTLRHYDEVGLLAPAAVDEETGYRYYTSDQLFRLHEIVALRQMGFSVAEVLQILDGQGVEPILSARKAALEEAYEALGDRIFRLNHYIDGRRGGKRMQYQAVVKEIPAYPVFSYRDTLDSYDDIFRMIHEIKEKLGRTNPRLACVEPDYCFNVYLDGEHRTQDIHVEFCQAVTAPGTDAEGIVFKEMPAATVVSVLHRGAYEDLGAAYAYAMQWVEANGYAIADHARESHIDGIWNKERKEDWLTEIQVPVHKVSSR